MKNGREEIRATAEDYDIDERRIRELDFRIMRTMFQICNSEDAADKRRAEMKDGVHLDEVYDILQDYNQREIGFYLSGLMGATLSQEQRVMMMRGRMEEALTQSNKIKDGDSDEAHALMMISSHLAISFIRGDI
jgi:hypothetical protein